jgi:hypothetical protein
MALVVSGFRNGMICTLGWMSRSMELARLRAEHYKKKKKKKKK